jgi:hypothetical protein
LLTSGYNGIQGGSGYGSYLAIVFFKGMYPNAIGKLITYDFAYTYILQCCLPISFSRYNLSVLNF